MEVERILRASSGSRYGYQPSLAAAGRRVAASVDHERRTSASSAAQTLQTSRPSLAERGTRAGWQEFDEHDVTAPPTPVGHWVPARPRAVPLAEDERGPQRDAFTEPASVRGERHRSSFQSSRVEYEPQLRAERSRTPEPQLRSAARNLNPRGDDGPDGSGFWGPGNSPYASYASQRHSIPARGPPSWQEEYEYDEPAGGEALPPLPSKAELHQYIRELVEAKSELRDHFRHGAFAGVKAHYGYR
jgi:hypothetical protein